SSSSTRRGGGSGGNSRSSQGEMTPPPWRSSHQHNDVSPRRQKSFDPDKEIELEHKSGDVLLPPWATAAAAATAAAGRSSISDHARSRQKYGGFSDVQRRPPPGVCSKDWADVGSTARQHNDGRGGGGGGGGRGSGGGGENGRRVVEYHSNGDAVPPPQPPPPSSASFSVYAPSCWEPERERPRAELGSGPARMERPVDGRNGRDEDGRQRPTPTWTPQPLRPAAALEHPIKLSRTPVRSYEEHPGRAQMHPISRRSRAEDHPHQLEQEEAATAAAAAAAAPPARTPPSPPATAPTPSPPPCARPPAAAAAVAAPKRARVEQQQKQQPRQQCEVGAPGQKYTDLWSLIPDLARMGCEGRSTSDGVKTEGPGNGLSGMLEHSAAAAGAAGVGM
ncbi:unnamed protein product, partial [Laminaria digitata]